MNYSRDAIIGLVVLVLVLLGIVWYLDTHQGTAPSVPGEMATSTPVAEGALHITEHAQYYDIDAQYPSSTPLVGLPESADVDAVALMKQWELDTVASFKSDSGLDSLTPQDIEVQQLGGDRKYGLTITYVSHTSPHTVSYVYTIFADTLGAHPNTTYKTFTFDTTNGLNLSLAMLFTPSTDYLGAISTIAKADLPTLIAARENVNVSDVDMDMLNAGVTPTIDNYQDFYLDGSDLVILFPPYAIGPYVLGSTEFHIPFSKLPGLKADYTK